MKKYFFATILAFSFLLTPAYVTYARGIVPDCNVGVLEKQANGSLDYKEPCDFNYFIKLANNVISFLLFYLATPLFAIGFCYAGFLYLTASGNEENVGQAKRIIKNMIMGYVIALAAWLIIKTIMSSLGFTGPMFLK